MRPGANLYTNSVVALDYRTGKLAWYAQQTPHDTHDWDTAAAPTLYSQDGRDYMVAGDKGGYVYLYDRKTHKLIARTEVSPRENVEAPITPQGTHHCPGIIGGVQWNGAAYAPPQRLLYVNSVHWCGTTALTESRYVAGSAYTGARHTWDPVEQAKGFTRALDAASGKIVWTREVQDPDGRGAHADGRRRGVHRRPRRLVPGARRQVGRDPLPVQHRRGGRGRSLHLRDRRPPVRGPDQRQRLADRLEDHGRRDGGGVRPAQAVKRLGLSARRSVALRRSGVRGGPRAGIRGHRRARRAGVAQAAAREGYPLRSHVLYEVRDARAADPADGAVDAIVVATPLERTRHAAYIAAYSGRPSPPAQAYAEARPAAWQLAIVVFAHGADEADEAFARAFRPRPSRSPGEAAADGPARRQRDLRGRLPAGVAPSLPQVATITYRFDLSALRDAGTTYGTPSPARRDG
jgi:hypothetical protein